MITAKQNQKIPFHFLSAPPTPPAEEKKKGKEHFLVLPARVRECGRGALVRVTTQSERTRQFQATTRSARAKSGVLLEMGSSFFKQTPPKLICIRIDRARAEGASLGWHFRQEIPRGFEFRQKHSRRKSAVPKRSLDCAFSARADEERFLEIVGVGAMPLSI